MRTLSRRVIPILLLALALHGCAKAPPTLSPQAQTAFRNTQVIKGLDLLRDTAIDANAQTPPLMSEATTRKVVLYHKSAITIVHSTASGWQTVVLTGLDETVKNLPESEAQLLSPYVSLIKTVVQEVLR